VSDPYQSGAYGQANPDWHEADAPHKAAVLADVVRDLGWTPGTVADVGCGVGVVLSEVVRHLADERPDTIWEGWDPAPEAIERARRHERERLQFECGDFVRSDRHVDLALCVDVVEHVADDRGFLDALRERADRVVFRIPLDLSALDVVRPHRLLEARRTLHHVHAYTKAVALEVLEAAGFEVVHTRFDRIPPPRDTLRRQLVDAVRRGAFSVAPDATVALLGGWSLVVAAQSTSKR
jgi:SAM-dependent methyltransferase